MPGAYGYGYGSGRHALSQGVPVPPAGYVFLVETVGPTTCYLTETVGTVTYYLVEAV